MSDLLNCPFCGVHAERLVVPQRWEIKITNLGPEIIEIPERFEIRCSQSWCHASISLPSNCGWGNVIAPWNNRYITKSK